MITNKDPENRYRVFPICHDAARAENKDTLSMLNESGFGGLVTNPAWPEWMSDEKNVRRFLTLAKEARAAGKTVWYYDEVAYPSGWAGGYVTREHPECRAMNLAFVFARAKKGEEVRLELPEKGYAILSACTVEEKSYRVKRLLPVTDRECVAFTAEEDGLAMAFYLRQGNPGHIRSWKWQDLPYGFREHPDFLSAGAMERYVQGALEPVLTRLEKGTVEAVFTDEPALNCFYLAWDGQNAGFDSVPWTSGFSEKYAAAYGDTVLDKLPYLFFGDSDTARLTRVRFYGLLARLMRTNFTDRAREYCARFGTEFSGHFLLEEGLPYHVAYYGDYMRVMGGLSIPGCDVLLGDASHYFDANAGWKEGAAWDSNWLFAGKYPSSCARLRGRNVTMLELCPVALPEVFDNDSLNQRLSLCTYAIFTGCTRLNSYRWEVGEKEEKRPWNEYVGRILQNLREASPENGIALLYPIRDAQALQTRLSPEDETLSPAAWRFNHRLEQAALEIYEEKADFDFLTEEAIEEADVGGGTLSVGLLSVHTVILPAVTMLARAAAEKLAAFQKSGGRVLCLDTRPCLDENGDALEKTVGEFQVVASLIGLLADERALKITGEKIFRSTYRRDGKRLEMLVNADAEHDREAHIEGLGTLTVFDPETASVSELSLPGRLTVRAGRALLCEKTEND